MQDPEVPVVQSPVNPAEPQTAVSPPTTSRMLRTRAKKLLKPSVIRRICKVPKKKIKKSIKKTTAKVVYTNSQFGKEPIPCSESGCNSCSLAPPHRKLSIMSKIKLKCRECKAKNRSIRKNSITPPTEAKEIGMKEHHCFCTELDGQLYKLMDEHKHFNALSSLLLDLRAHHNRMPRLSTKRSVGNKPMGDRKCWFLG